jgi:hypothetical protein
MVLISFQGRANYTNLSRYSELCEKTYRRWFAKKLDFIEFNRIGNNEIIPVSATKVAALDCSFITKSGKMTYGLGNFYNGKQGKAETGLEISTLAIVDVDFNTAYHVSTRQTSDKCEEAVNHHAKLTRDLGKTSLKSYHPQSVSNYPPRFKLGVTLDVKNDFNSRNQTATFCGW